MERWDRTVLYINATSVDLGPKCLQLLGMHALSGCNTTSYLYSYQCAKYPACSRLPMCWVKWTRTTHTDLAKFVHCIVSFQGHQWVSLLQTLPQSDGPTSNIRKPVAACSAGLSTNYVVESSRPSRPTQ